MLAAQGARPGALDDLTADARAVVVRAGRGGYVASLDAVALGECARDLTVAAGNGAGIALAARTGDRVNAGDALATVYGGDETSVATVARAFEFSDSVVSPRTLVYGEIEAVSDSAGRADATLAASRSTLESR